MTINQELNLFSTLLKFFCFVYNNYLYIGIYPAYFMGKDLLMIQTGGTICQKKDSNGILKPSNEDYLHKVPEIYDLANIDVVQTSAIDSTDMSTEDRKTILDLLEKNYNSYDGFVVVQGTDTMEDTASSLNYMVNDTGKPIILTGSQKPIYQKGNDAVNNLYSAVSAATQDLGEVAIAFGERLLRGSRTIKEDAQGFNAFSSPKVNPLGIFLQEDRKTNLYMFGNHFKTHDKNPEFFRDLETNVMYYPQSSGSDTYVLEDMVGRGAVKGVVMGGYGVGNINSKYLPTIKRAKRNGIPIIAVTKCPKGKVDMGVYEVGSEPLRAGIIPGEDLTSTAATQKLMYALGKANKEKLEGKDRVEYVKNIIQTPFKGDMSYNP